MWRHILLHLELVDGLENAFVLDALLQQFLVTLYEEREDDASVL